MAYPSFLPFLKWNRVWRSFASLVTIIGYRSLPKTVLYGSSMMFRPSASTKVIHNLACVSTMEKHFHILRAKFILCPFTLPDDALLSCFLPLFQSYYVSPTVRAVHHFSVLYFALSSHAADLFRCSQVQNGSSAQKPSFGPNW